MDIRGSIVNEVVLEKYNDSLDSVSEKYQVDIIIVTLETVGYYTEGNNYITLDGETFLTNLSNEEVLNKVFSKLEYDNKEGFSIVNVNSKTNYKDGFDVYLVETSVEYAYANEYTYEYSTETGLLSKIIKKQTKGNLRFCKK